MTLSVGSHVHKVDSVTGEKIEATTESHVEFVVEEILEYRSFQDAEGHWATQPIVRLKPIR